MNHRFDIMKLKIVLKLRIKKKVKIINIKWTFSKSLITRSSHQKDALVNYEKMKCAIQNVIKKIHFFNKRSIS